MFRPEPSYLARLEYSQSSVDCRGSNGGLAPTLQEILQLVAYGLTVCRAGEVQLDKFRLLRIGWRHEW